MKKQNLDEDIKKPDNNKPKIYNWGMVKTIAKLDELLDEHGTVFIVNPTGVPIKMTKVELV